MKSSLQSSFRFLFMVLMIQFFACTGGLKPENSNTTIRTLETENYKAMVPLKFTAQTPLLFILDPHADFDGAIGHFDLIGRKRNLALLALKKVQNNEPDFIEAINTAKDEFMQSEGIHGNPVYLAGFSGGARMAYIYAQRNRVDGVLMCGAGIGNNAGPHSFPIVQLCGWKDFNLLETYYSPMSPQARNNLIYATYFKGKHQWPEEEYLQLGIDYLLVRNGILDKNEIQYPHDFIDEYSDFKEVELKSKLNFSDDSKAKMARILVSDKFQDYISGLEQILIQENKEKNEIFTSLQDKPLIYWDKQLDEWRQAEKDESHFAWSASRKKAFVGMALYSLISREFRGQADVNKLKRWLEIYRLFEPENPDEALFRAQLEAYSGNKKQCKMILDSLVNSGYSDMKRIHAILPN